MRKRFSKVFLGIFLLRCFVTYAWGIPDTFQDVSVVLGWIQISPDWLGTEGLADEQITEPLCYQLSQRDEFRVIIPPEPQMSPFLVSVEHVLLAALQAPELNTHRPKAVILVVSGSRWEPEDAQAQAQQLALLKRVSAAFLAKGAKLYGIVTDNPPHAAFLIQLADACNLNIDGPGTYWFKAENPGQLANAYARILMDLRRLDSTLYVRGGLSTTRLLLAVGIVLMMLAGMGWLTWWLLPHAWLMKLLWWRKSRKGNPFDDRDLVEELDTVILGTVPEGDEEAV